MDDTKFKTGRKKTGGRKKGTPNKTTTGVKEAILRAFDQVGGEDYLVRIAEDEPRIFCSLIGRILPAEARIETRPMIDYAKMLNAAIARGEKAHAERRAALESGST
jgi:hypothetical protein